MSNYKNKETEVLGYIRAYLSDNGFPPTVREVCQAMGFSSSATGQYYINKLKKMGLIANKESRNRAISLLGEKQEIAMVPIIGTVTAGTPIMAVENFDGYFPLPEEFKPDEDTFILTVRGNSMINAGILNGDKIIVKKNLRLQITAISSLRFGMTAQPVKGFSVATGISFFTRKTTNFPISF